MEEYRPDYSKNFSAFMFNINITEMESRMNIQKEDTQNLLGLLLANQGIGSPTPTRKAQGNNTSGDKWVDAPNEKVLFEWVSWKWTLSNEKIYYNRK